MKEFTRYALLIGYSGWDLKDNERLDGVYLDIGNYKKYLMSTRGGAWKEKEIKILYDTSKNNILTEMEQVKKSNYDMVFIVYSGHGCYLEKENCRELQISKNEFILEKDFYKLNDKQLIAILDTCAKTYEQLKEEEQKLQMSECLIQTRKIFEEIKFKKARENYENKCKTCSPQKLILYAAQKGYCAKDTIYGGYYSANLLNKITKTNVELDFKKVHEQVSSLVKVLTLDVQIPDFKVIENKFEKLNSVNTQYLPAIIIV